MPKIGGNLVICGDEGTMKYGFKDVVIDSRTGLNPRKNFVLGNGDNNYITIKDIYNGQINITDKTDKVGDDAIQIIKKRSRIKVGDILFVSIGRIGETAIVTAKDDTWDVNESVFVFTINREIITPEYFCTLFQSNAVQKYLSGNSSGSTFKSIKMNQLEKMIFDLPSLDVQKDITAKLSTVKSICNLRTSELMHLDSLIKARFVEMFFDKGYPVLRWNDVFNTTTGKLDSNAMVEDGEYPFFTCAKEVLRIDKYAFDQEALLLAGNNAAGKYDVKYYKGKFNAYQRTYVLGLKQNWSYRLFQYQLEDKLVYLQQQSLGGLTKYLTMKILGDLSFIIPPMDKQIEFEQFVKQVDKSKVAVQKALDKAQLLFDSLMQEYFG